MAENFNRVSRVHEHYRRQTDERRHIANMNSPANVNVSSHCERGYKFTKNYDSRHLKTGHTYITVLQVKFQS